MDNRERLFKISLDVISTVLLLFLNINIWCAILLAHTINLFINGHYYVLKKNIGKGRTDPAFFIGYINKIYGRIQKVTFFVGAAAYGSLSRNEFKDTSDFDVRIFPNNDSFSWLKTVIWVALERFRALLNSFPLDIYAFDLDVIDSKMRSDEPPILLSDPKGEIARKYLNHVQFSEFLLAFNAKHLNGAG